MPGRQTDRQTYRQRKGLPGKQTGIQIRNLVRQIDRKTEKQMERYEWTDMDGQMVRQKDSPWQTDKKFPKQAERRLEAKTGRQVLARQVCHADRFGHVCHADRFAMQTDLSCRQVCHAGRQKAHQY